MTECLCCQKPLESDQRYHPKCLKELFGNASVPAIPFSKSDMSAEVRKIMGRMSISGVQIKASVRLEPITKELKIVATGGTHLLKPEPDEFPELPQNENLCMNIAMDFGMRVPPHGLFPMKGGKLCYIIKRFDREGEKKIHKETLFQVLNAEEKYHGSLEQIGKAIHRYAKNIGLDSIDFFERVLLCFFIGNGDMHLKNWALLVGEENAYHLAPCYDLVSSKIYLHDEEESALAINGKKNKLQRKDFEALATKLEIEPKAVKNIFEKFLEAKGKIVEMANHSELTSEKREALEKLILTRFDKIYR